MIDINYYLLNFWLCVCMCLQCKYYKWTTCKFFHSIFHTILLIIIIRVGNILRRDFTSLSFFWIKTGCLTVFPFGTRIRSSTRTIQIQFRVGLFEVPLGSRISERRFGQMSKNFGHFRSFGFKIFKNIIQTDQKESICGLPWPLNEPK